MSSRVIVEARAGAFSRWCPCSAWPLRDWRWAGRPPESDTSVARYQPTAADYYINYAPPRDEPEIDDPAVPVVQGTQDQRRPRSSTRSTPSGNPVAARVLAAREREAIRTGSTPRTSSSRRRRRTKTAKLLTLLVEFNDNANDDFSGFTRPATRRQRGPGRRASPSRRARCSTARCTTRSPNPANAAHKDNNPSGSPDFSPDALQQDALHRQGITERVRPDLTGPGTASRASTSPATP